jgi:CRISPR/Cas system-associated exonuclease Cas4 (RecB family)
MPVDGIGSVPTSGSRRRVTTYSYTQLAHYLACPKRYRYRYLDGWRERETRAATVFGRAFELALGALFRREDPAAAFWEQWQPHRDRKLEYAKGDTWEKMNQEAVQLLGLFAAQERVRVPRPDEQLQVKYAQPLSPRSEFVAYIDAIGELDGRTFLLEWKTSSARYPEQPSGLYSLDPQLVAYSWMTGISHVALVIFVRKRLPEIQYLPVTISESQRREYGFLVHQTIRQIERAQFLPHPGVRFPQNGCVSCAHQGLCLANPALVACKLERRPGDDALDWVDELAA